MSRRRLPTVLLSLLAVGAVVVAALLVVPAPAPAVELAASGHWVAAEGSGAAVHVDGGTGRVDARVELPADFPEPVLTVQNGQQGFVVARDRVVVFGKGTLTVESTTPLDSPELPFPIETTGGPYLVYQQAGTVVRLGTTPATLPVGGPLSRPAWTDNGEVWVHRTDSGALCEVGPAALDCAGSVEPGEPGSLTVVSGQVVYLSTRRDAVEPTAPGTAAVGLGTDLPDDALVADRDTRGRLAVVVPGSATLLLLDDSRFADGVIGAPIAVPLGTGRFTAPIASDGLVAVIDEEGGRLLVFDVSGRLLSTTALPPGSGANRLVRGEDGRIYVDDSTGAVTRVVGSDGSVTSVDTSDTPSDSVTVAAPPWLAAPTQPVDLPRIGGPGPVDPGQGGSGPTDGSGPPTRPQPPSGVMAKAVGDGSITVTWQAVAGATRYLVRSDSGSTMTVTSTSATFPALPLGRPVAFTVVATTSAGDTDPSASSNVVSPLKAAAAPGGLAITVAACDGGWCFPASATATWTAPDLAGGRLDHYQVTVTQKGKAVVSLSPKTTTATLQGSGFLPCQATTFSVVAVTTPAGGGDEVQGAPATYVITPSISNSQGLPDCSGAFSITNVRITGPNQITGTIVVSTWQVPTRCVVDAINSAGKQAKRWTGPCGGGYGRDQHTDVVIDGLPSGDSYTLSGSGGNDWGHDAGTQDTNTSLTMP